MFKECLLTFDTDWAPDFVIHYVIEKLIEKNIRATWFITHDSPITKKIIEKKDLFEVGIHPNFFPTSTQGQNEDEVMKYFEKFMPNTKIIRTHALFQSTFLLRKLVKEYDIEIDVSLLLSHTPNLIPHKIFLGENLKDLIRIPFFWEDDLEMYNPYSTWELKNNLCSENGIKIFNFHPIHIFLNSRNIKNYESLKNQKSLNEYKEGEIESYRNKNEKGTENFFDDICNYIIYQQKQSYTISEIVSKWKNNLS